MAFAGSCARLVFGRIVPILVLLVAIIAGWLSRFEQPVGVLMAIAYPLMKWKLPPIIVGHGKMTGVPSVPEDFRALARPTNEMFLELPDGQRMPQNGLGMCCRYSAYDDELVRRSVLWYLLLGGRSFDTASVYFNHRAIGQGIRDAIAMTQNDPDNRIVREDIFVTTKVFPNDFGYNRTLSVTPRYVEELGLEYVDLVLMHWPKDAWSLKKNDCSIRGISDTECRLETFQALSELKRNGLIRNIGVSNFAKHHLQPMLEQKEKYNLEPIAMNQIQYNPWAPDFAVETFQFCKDNGIGITAYTSLGGALQNAKVLSASVLHELSEKHGGRSVSQLLLRWALQVGAAIIPGTGNPKHMQENLSVYDFELSDEDMDAITALRSDKEGRKIFYVKPLD